MKRAIFASLFVSLYAATAFAGSYSDNNKTVTQDCAKDPEAIINGNKNTITFTGECTSITVAGNDNTLAIASVKALRVPGNKNTVAVDATDQIRTDGNDNTVTWKKPIAAKKPAVSNPGTKNKISQAK